jgi:glycogen synthase
MKILMISSEGWPLARSGALADVLVALPRELKARGHEMALAMPTTARFARTRRSKPGRSASASRFVRRKNGSPLILLEGRTAEDLQIFFVRCDEL